MMKNKIADIRKGMKRISVVLALAMVFTLAEPAVAEPGTGLAVGRQAGTGAVSGVNQVQAASEAPVDYQTILKETSASIEKKLTTYKVEMEDGKGGTFTADWYGPANASIGGEWAVIGESRYGMQNAPWYRAYYENLMRVLQAAVAQASEDGTTTGTATVAGTSQGIPLKLDSKKGTENSRAILALTSIGVDAANVEGYDLTAALSDLSYVKKQGLNGPIWALIALDSGNYKIPQLTSGNTASQTTREGLLAYILSRELTSGGFNLTKNNAQGADPDVTAMALQAFAPYYTGRISIGTELSQQIKEAVERNLQVLSGMQKSSGAYSSYGSENVESTAQVLVVLSSLGIDGRTDSRFIKNGHSVLDGLEQFYLTGKGTFEHVASDGGNQMATEQAFYALVSYDRYMNKKNTLYDMTDAEDARIMALSACQVKVSQTTYTYAGKKVTPGVTVSMTGLDGVSRKLTAGTDYTVTYKNNTKPGKASVKITGMGMYKETISQAVSIYPGKASVTSVVNDKKGLTVKWKKVTGADRYVLYRKAGSGAYKKYKTISGTKTAYTDTSVKNGTIYSYRVCASADGLQGKNANTKTFCRVTAVTAKAAKAGRGKITVSWKKNSKAGGYQIRYSQKSSLSGAKTVSVRSGKTTVRKLSGLKRGKRYYMTVRAYKTIKGKKYYSCWSGKISVKVQ